jgi:SOS-response transcriptional repressor LexA
MKTLGQRLKEARLEAKRTQEEVGAAAGVSKSAVGQWEADTDATTPTGPNLYYAAELLGVTEHWLVTGKPPKYRKFGKNLELIDAQILSVPLVSWVQAGLVGEAFDPYSSGVGEEYYPVPYHRASLIALRVHGHSMNREAPEGAIIVVDYEDKVLVSGCLYVFKTAAGEVGFKRYRANPDRFEPSSTEDHETIFPAPGWTVIGRVIQVIRRV